jgi:hypothetical protein
MAECPKRLFNASSWEGLKSIAVEAETKVDKFGKTAYTVRFYISSLDDIREAARAARMHWILLILYKTARENQRKNYCRLH